MSLHCYLNTKLCKLFIGDILIVNICFCFFSDLSKDSTPMSAWACGQSDTWSQLKRGFKNLSVEFATLSDKAGTQVCVCLRFTEL